ncbi:hypothetical protein [Naasia sp. SYSU D00057]|uniref:hypothetical protein n=1 Tax=Naasia sp. SYSU D00057 TaxID=2817380 RepID=UPI001B30D6B3|nr:hypothetical protein [Naasia sp. SYSU D00057]
MRLPDLLTADHLPAAELEALRLDGVLYPLAGSWRPVDLPETGEARAAAVALVLRDRLVADRLTAAWVLGAADCAPVPLQACAPADDRGAAGAADLDVRELHLLDGDVVRVGSLRLTTSLRTAADLLRGSEWGRREADAVRRLLTLCGREALAAALDETRFGAHRKRAVARLAAIGR